MTLSNSQISAIGIVGLFIVIMIFFVPIIPVNPAQSQSLAVCVTDPCEDMVVVQEKITVFNYLGDRDNIETLTPLAPDDVPDVGACTLQYDPVCGTDGVTYGNLCQLELTEEVELAFIGEC